MTGENKQLEEAPEGLAGRGATTASSDAAISGRDKASFDNAEDSSNAAAFGGSMASETPSAEAAFDAAKTFGATTISSDTAAIIKSNAAEIEPQIIEWRRFFHRHPEVSGAEVKTSAAIRAELDKMGVEYRTLPTTDKIKGAGIIATIKGTAPDAYDDRGVPKRRVALRADFDALPITEQTGLEFASENEGAMHACGHDCHIAMMLGTIELLSRMTDRLHGEVRVLFQPSEENSSGARYMMANGALEGVESIYGAHIWSEVPAGAVSCEPGQRMANCDWFEIDVKGMSAHGSMPHLGIDAVVVGAAIVNSIQVLVSRDVSPFDPVVVTVGKFEGGEARNIIAGSAHMEGTIRTWSAKLRAEVPKRLEHIVEELADSLGASAAFSYSQGNPGLSNDPVCAAAARKAVVDVLGEQAVATYQGTLSGEDFSEYLNVVPGVLAFVGTNNPAIGAVHPQHSCNYLVDESVLAKGAMVAAQWASTQLA